MRARFSSPKRRRAAGAVTATAAVLVALALSSTSPEALAEERGKSDAGAPAPLPACVKVTSQARYVPYGWSHVVVLANGCEKDASCVVATDVNPEKQTVAVPKASTVEVVTFLASPSQAFVPKVSCTLR